MKESYVAEAKLRRKKGTESFRDFGQAIEDLYRRAYPNNREHVQEISMKTIMDNCSGTEDFRLAVRRTRPKTLQDAVTTAMQEECIRMTEDQTFAKTCYKCNSSEHLYKMCPQRSFKGIYRNGNRRTGSQRLNEDRPRQ